jgi:hypothetical protein
MNFPEAIFYSVVVISICLSVTHVLSVAITRDI